MKYLKVVTTDSLPIEVLARDMYKFYRTAIQTIEVCDDKTLETIEVEPIKEVR